MYPAHTPPENKFYMYHPTKAPAGQLFEGTREKQRELANAGWFDSPAKFGNNVMGPDYEEGVQKIKAEVAMGARKALDDESYVDQNALEAFERKQKELEEREKSLRQQEDAFTKMRQGQVERADHLKGGELHPNKKKIEVPPIKRAPKKPAAKPKPQPKAEAESVDLNI